MKKKTSIFLYLSLVFCLSFAVNTTKAEAKKLSLSAESAIVMDVQSGTILYEKNMDKKEYPASITKIMTTLIALENSSMSETVTYSKNAVTNLESGASNIDLKPGEKMSMENSLYAVMLASANEACNGVAEHVAGSIDEFVNMMNERAKELGCTGTHFANPNGLWLENHYTTAHDMALIAREAYKNPTFAKITGTKRYSLPSTNKTKYKRTLVNHHEMLVASKFSQYVYDYCVGGKTGYTSKCRYTLVTFAKKDGMTLVSVVMRADSPWDSKNEYTDSTKLLNYGFENFTRYRIQDDATNEINSNYLFTKFSPFFNQSTSSLTIDEDADVILPKNVGLDETKKNVEFYTESQTTSDGKTIIGKITYTYNNKEVGGSNIYYTKQSLPTLEDSIDMSTWFDEAVEKANKKPFQWKKAILIGILILIVLVVLFIAIQRIHAEREQRERRNRYKKSKRNQRRGNDGVYYRRK
jgi:D-alanyl-D-alanine carboxypeptidase